MQLNPHALALHVGFALVGAVHTVAQSPQWVGVEVRSTHWPLQFASVPQSAEQVPLRQTWFIAQSVPQAPQFERSETRFRQELLHGENPWLHAIPQLPEVQIAEPSVGTRMFLNMLDLLVAGVVEDIVLMEIYARRSHGY